MTEVKVGQKWRAHSVEAAVNGMLANVVSVDGDDVRYTYTEGPWRDETFVRASGDFLKRFQLVGPKPQASTALEGNPKDAIGSAKAPSMTVPTTIHALDGLAMLEGALKYGRHNYRAAPVRASVYVDALERHLKSWIEGEEIDPDSDLPHLAKARACLGIILDAQICGTLIDDRPPAKVPPGFFAECNKKAAALVAKYPNPVAPYTQVGAKQPVEVELDALKARTQPR